MFWCIMFERSRLSWQGQNENVGDGLTAAFQKSAGACRQFDGDAANMDGGHTATDATWLA